MGFDVIDRDLLATDEPTSYEHLAGNQQHSHTPDFFSLYTPAGQAVEAMGLKNIILTGLWTGVCVTCPALSMLDVGCTIYVVEGSCGAG